MSQPLPSPTVDFSAWYNEIVLRAELADYSPVRGCMVIRPYGYDLWEAVKAALDQRFRQTGHRNAYFPLFIPMSFLEKEAEHVEGFAPHLAVVTHGGGKPLEEPLVVRPTSETIIGHMYAQWIKSYRDLPVLINQWANVVRWEQRTRLFLRTMEFLWQEGHTAHATYEEAQAETLRMLDVYIDFAVHEAAIPVVAGQKSDTERFAGGLASYTIEAMMGDHRALQAGTSHNLGQNFARAFNIQYQDRDNQLQHCWTTSWGVSTRMVGAIVMVHGDARGLRLPPRLAPIQIVIVPIAHDARYEAEVTGVVGEVAQRLTASGIRVHVDDRPEHSPGWKFNEWEMRGVPLRLEVGHREVVAGQVAAVRRDVLAGDGRVEVPLDTLVAQAQALLTDIQTSLLRQARQRRDAHIQVPLTLADLQQVVADGWARAWWCGSRACEERIKDETRATNRCIPLDLPPAPGRCVVCGAQATQQAYFARAY